MLCALPSVTSTLTLASKRHRRPLPQLKALGEAAAAAAVVAAAAAAGAAAGAAVVGAPEVAADAAGVLSAAAAEKVSSVCVQLHARPLMTSPQLTHLLGGRRWAWATVSQVLPWA